MILAPHLLQSSPWFHEFNRLFDAAFARVPAAGQPVRLLADDDGWTLELDVPGLARDAFAAEVRDEILHLAITRGESNVSRYRVPLGRHVDASRLTARLEDGVLTLRLPKAQEPSPHRIEIL